MFNLYREEEKEPRKTLKQKLDSLSEDIKLSYATSKHFRNKSIKTVTKLIENLQPTDIETIDKITGLIKSFDLCDARYGKTIEKATYNKLLDVVHQNKDLAETEASLRKNLVCYEIAERNM